MTDIELSWYDYVDPLEADSSQETIGVSCSQGVFFALGNASMDEWIRVEYDNPSKRCPVER